MRMKVLGSGTGRGWEVAGGCAWYDLIFGTPNPTPICCSPLAVAVAVAVRLQVLAGGLSGVLAWLPIYPLDVVKTRVQAVAAAEARGRGVAHYAREVSGSRGKKVLVTRVGGRGRRAGGREGMGGEAGKAGCHALWRGVQKRWESTELPFLLGLPCHRTSATTEYFLQYHGPILASKHMLVTLMPSLPLNRTPPPSVPDAGRGRAPRVLPRHVPHAGTCLHHGRSFLPGLHGHAAGAGRGAGEQGQGVMRGREGLDAWVSFHVDIIGGVHFLHVLIRTSLLCIVGDFVG